MITFITGVPGSGKTLYCIDKLLRDIVGKTVTAKDQQNNTVEIQRTVYTNIKGLLLDHELIDAAWLTDWHNRAKPGDVICYDEVQEVWKPRANGSKVPEDIGKLETHRHMGVDFILISQHPLLVDRNILQLVGRHLHVRRVSSIGAAVVYEWDHCSRSLLYKNAMTKWPWRYSKEVFKLYKSAELHTKQKRKMPGLVWFILIGIACFAWFGPQTYANIANKGKPPTTTATVKPPQQTTVAALAAPVSPASAPEPAKPAETVKKAAFAGCASANVKGRIYCKCFDEKGESVDPPPDACPDTGKPASKALELLPEPQHAGRPSSDPKADAELVEWARNRPRFY